MATVLTIFLRIDIPNFVQACRYDTAAPEGSDGMIFTRPGRCRYGIPSHTVPLRALVLFIFDTDRIVSLVCGAGSMKRSSLHLSVRPSVCPVDRQQHRLLAGLLLSAVRAAYQLQVPSSNGTAARRSAANAGSATFTCLQCSDAAVSWRLKEQESPVSNKGSKCRLWAFTVLETEVFKYNF